MLEGYDSRVAAGKRRAETDRRRPAKERILAASKALFTERGYVGTSIPEIARAAGVAVPTVYWAYGSKRAIVAEIHAGWRDDERTSAALRRVTAIADPHDRLDAYAAFVRQQWETGADVLAIEDDARRADPLVRDVIAPPSPEMSRELLGVVEPLKGSLRRGLSMTEARDVLFALSSLDVYRELRERGWTSGRYERWLGRTLRESLLGVDRPWWTATMGTG